MDQRAYLWANRLLDNEPTAPALEITMGGFSLRFEVETMMALTGADCGAMLDHKAVGNWRTFHAEPGQTLRLGFSAGALRAYAAFPGGLEAPSLFGSSSTVLRDGLPGILGRPVRPGETLRWLEPDRSVPLRSVPAQQLPPRVTPIELPLITGYEWLAFSADDRERVFETEWTVQAASDRTACRLAAARIDSGPLELDSTPLVDGTVQVPGDGEPLIFMRDRPTIGGYPKLGSVDPIALDLLAQAQPGSRVRFVPADADRVLAGLVRREAFFGIADR